MKRRLIIWIVIGGLSLLAGLLLLLLPQRSEPPPTSTNLTPTPVAPSFSLFYLDTSSLEDYPALLQLLDLWMLQQVSSKNQMLLYLANERRPQLADDSLSRQQLLGFLRRGGMGNRPALGLDSARLVQHPYLQLQNLKGREVALSFLFSPEMLAVSGEYFVEGLLNHFQQQGIDSLHCDFYCGRKWLEEEKLSLPAFARVNYYTLHQIELLP